MITTFERGKIEGANEALRETALMQLDKKFSPLTPEVRKYVTELNADQLRQLLENILTVSSLRELQLGD